MKGCLSKSPCGASPPKKEVLPSSVYYRVGGVAKHGFPINKHGGVSLHYFKPFSNRTEDGLHYRVSYKVLDQQSRRVQEPLFIQNLLEHPVLQSSAPLFMLHGLLENRQ